MAHRFAKLALFGPVLAVAAGCSAVSASNDTRAISLNVVEGADSVEIQVIANSTVTQQIEFKAELTGASNSRHNSSSTVAAGDKQVLSRMKISSGDGWCAKVDVTEASGAKYTLTAGDCGLL
ncbi:hypothetical protein EH31_08280 [Erythrobacter longus]|uniref:Lipoprotein n=1 Tax=Erythrobacter longus TaxID=1044 RepID=A0A074M9J1_ERYLO|nr:hypothetical protein [Erythrobacter longus]KEO90079.1 hypothetical protein EH31_08280 [Erythrobacter longus]